MSFSKASGTRPHDAPFPFWLANFIETPEGRRYSFEGRPYLVEIAADAVSHPYLVIEKGSQLGMTVLFILALFYQMARGELPAGAVYFFPTDGDVRDLSKTKAEPLIRKNYFVTLCPRPGDVYLKSFAGKWLFFRGTVSTVRMKMLSADIACFDEADEITPEARKVAQERIHASPLQWQRHFSIPSVPGYGIDQSFQASDQRYWTFLCAGCRHEFDLETTFPKSLARHNDGTVTRCCPQCQRGLDLNEGRWIARNPSSKVRGYHLSQLFSPSINPADLLNEFETTDRLGAFFRGRIGLPYVEAAGKVDKSEVLALQDPDRPRVETSLTPCYLGVDVGKVLHWVAVNVEGKKIRVLGMGEEKSFDDMRRRLHAFHASRTVMDALPDAYKAIEFAKALHPKVWLSYYNVSRPQPPTFSEDEERKFLRVDSNRTERLDKLIDMVRTGRSALEIPRQDPVVEEFAYHFTQLIRTEEADPETGELTRRYLKIGADHYAHAMVYALLAAGELRGPVQSRIYPV